METTNVSVLNMSIGCSRDGDLAFLESTWPADLGAEGPERGAATGPPRLLPMSRVRGPMRTALLAQGALTPEDLVDPEEDLDEQVGIQSPEARGVTRLLLLMPSGDGQRVMQPRHFDGCGPRLRWMEPSSQRAGHVPLRLSARRPSSRACPAADALGSVVAALRAARAMRNEAYLPSMAALQAGEGSMALTTDLSYQAKAEQMMHAFADDVAKVRARVSHREVQLIRIRPPARPPARHHVAVDIDPDATLLSHLQRTEVALLEEESGSTFFIATILKLVIAPFVAICLDPIAQPAARKMSDFLTQAKTSGGIVGAIATFIGMILAVIMGFIVAVAVAESVGEATVYHSTYLIVDNVARHIPASISHISIPNLNDYLFTQAMPMQKDIIVGLCSDALSDSITYGLHHTLTNALGESLSSSLAQPTMHYYYCVYCYYYGNFCDICFKITDTMMLKRQWWLGSANPGVVG